MERKRRWALVGFAVSLITTLLAGAERLEAGKTRQAILFFAGAAIGIAVYARRRRRESRAAAAALSEPSSAPGDETASARGSDA